MVNSYHALLCNGTEALSGHSDTPRLDAEVLLKHLLKKDRIWFAIHAKDTPDLRTVSDFNALIDRRKSGEPVAYITGEREFMGLPFKVKKGVLIPRPDTETLVEAVLNEKLPSKARIIDLCTGSGAIAISLAHFIPDTAVCAVDISDICIDTAQINAAHNNVSDRVSIIQADILDERFALPAPFALADVLVSNPPYIEKNELAKLMTDVRDFEPTLALDGGEDGLIFYRRIAALLPQLLKKGGLLALEVGHNQAEAVAEILLKSDCSAIGFARDLSGIRRVVMARR